MPQNVEPLKILCFGDSIMHCSGVTKDFKHGYLSYRLPLMKMLQRTRATATETLRPFITVGPNLGCNKKLDAHMNATALFGGDEFRRSDSFFGRPLTDAVHELRASILKHSPDLLVFSLGTNDVIKGSNAQRLLPLYQHAIDIILRIQSESNSNNNNNNNKMLLSRGTLVLTTLRLDVNRPGIVRRYRKAGQRLNETNDNLAAKLFDCSMPVKMSASSVVGDCGRRGDDGNEDNKNTVAVCPLKSSSSSSDNNKLRRNLYLLRVDEGFQPRSMTYDAIHPSPAGEEFIARKVFPAIAQLLWGTTATSSSSNSNKRQSSCVTPAVETTRDAVSADTSRVRDDIVVTSSPPKIVLSTSAQTTPVDLSDSSSTSSSVFLLAAFVCVAVVGLVLVRVFFGSSGRRK